MRRSGRYVASLTERFLRTPVMNVPLLDLKAQYAGIRTEIRAALDRVAESQQFILGPEVEALEREVAAFVGAEHGIGMSSGTDALLAALMALDVGAGDEVVMPTFTFFATAGVAARLGAVPVFVDIDPDTFNVDPAALAAAITPRTRAIIPVHLFGRVADMDAVMAHAAERAIPVIEDAAQAIGATGAGGQGAGAVGDMGAFSFFPSKNLGGFGDGGMVTTSDAGLAHRLRLLRMHGMEPKYHHAVVGGNFRLDALQAAVLRVKLPHLDSWRDGRRRNAEIYRTLFRSAGLDATVRLPDDVPGHVYNQFVVRVPDRDRVRAALAAAGIATEIYYPLPLHLQPCFRPLGYEPGMLPHAEQAAAEVLALPIYPELTPAQIAAVVSALAGGL
jgi:dTDP-4-amino-4,6-dideoxygalactose transaminase